MCLNALNDYIPKSSYYLDSYLINMSDGFPTFESSAFKYKGKSAILDTTKAVNNIKRKGVKILSYVIDSPSSYTKRTELVKDIRTIYGKSATFIDPKNVRLSYDTFIAKNSIIEPFVNIKTGVRIHEEVCIINSIINIITFQNIN